MQDFVINAKSPTSKVGIAVDSSASLTPETVAALGISVAPMTIRIGRRSFIDAPSLDRSHVYRVVDSNPNQRISVAAPDPTRWLQAIQAAARNVDSVLCLTLSAGLSASYDSARVAADAARKAVSTVNVQILDSNTVSGALALLAATACETAARDAEIQEVIDSVESAKHDITTVATLDTLQHLRGVARIPARVLRVADRASVKPLVEFSDDGFRLIGGTVTTRLTHRRLLRALRTSLGERPARFVVLHVESEARARLLARSIRTDFECETVAVSDFHPFIGLHAGRGALGVAWQRM